MESTHARNVGLAKFVNDCLYDTKNPAQQKDASVRNSIAGFPILLYINDELQGVYNFNLDRYSTKPYGYTDTEKCLVYEVSANSDTTAGAFYKWSESSGKSQLDYYKSDFECLYPPTRANGNDNMSELIRLIEWVNDSSDEDFKDNIGRYFNLEYLLRYYLFVLVFGAVDSLGKNMKLTTWDGLVWYPQVYDADTTIGLDNTGFLKFDMDIEMGDKNVFNTTGSQLWKKVVLLFDAELKQQYSLMRQDRFTVDNIMKYLYGEQISQIPAYYYNKDMQAKYLNFGSSYLYALHGSGEQHIRKWIRERLMYCDTLLGYRASSSDYITLRSSKLGEVYLDVETYIPMYLSIKWRDEANNTGLQTKRVGRGEKVRFTYNMPTATDQEIIVYAGHYLKSLGDVSNLQPTSMLIANADRLTEIECHSPNLINTDLSECTKLQRIDLSDCTALGTGIGAQPILNIQNCKYLRYCNCMNTQLTAIYTMQAGGNLEEIYYPETTQVVQLTNQTYLHTVGIPYGYNDLLKSINEYYQNVSYSYFNSTYDKPSITENAGSDIVSVRTKIPVEYGVTYTLVMGGSIGSCYFWEFDKNDKFVDRPVGDCKAYGSTRCNYTPTSNNVKYICPTFKINNWSIFKENARLYKSEEVDVFKCCQNLANVQISNCNAIKYLQYPFRPNDPINFDSLKYVQNLNITNSLSGLNSMQFNGFDKLKNVTLSSLKELDTIGFEDMMPVTTTSTLKNITISDCPLITSLSFNVSSDDYKVAFASGGKLDLGGLQSLKSIECNTSVKGLDTLIVPTSLTDLRFTTEYGDGINEIKNIWSASAVHNNDGFEGIDFQDMTIEFIDMLGLNGISNAINFHIAPKTQNPNLNTARDGSTDKPWFHPIGSIDLSNYTGLMIGMLRGVDLNKLDVVINANRDQVDLTSLFECATLPTAQNIVTKTNNILAKFPKSVIWDYMFKGCDLSFSPKDITIPNRGLSLKGMYKDSNVTEDVSLPNVIMAVDEMFMNCTGITTYEKNWLKTYAKITYTVPASNGTSGLWDDNGNYTEGTNYNQFLYTLSDGEKAFKIMTTGTGVVRINYFHNASFISRVVYTPKFDSYPYVVTIPDGCNKVIFVCDKTIGFASEGTITTSNCYTNTGGVLSEIPVSWGGYGLDKNVTSIYVIDTTHLTNTTTFNLVLQDNQAGVTDWGDGITNSEKSHTYAEHGVYTIKTKSWSNGTPSDDLKNALIEVKQIKLIGHNGNSKNYSNSFNGCNKLRKVTAYDLAPTNCDSMFKDCSSLTEIIGVETWDMSNCDTIQSIFQGCTSLTGVLDLSSWDLSSLGMTREAFYNSGFREIKFNKIPLPSLGIGDYFQYGMFMGCSNLISNPYLDMDTSRISSISLRNCSSLGETLDLRSIDTTNLGWIEPNPQCTTILINPSKPMNMAFRDSNVVTVKDYWLDTTYNDAYGNYYYNDLTNKSIDINFVGTDYISDWVGWNSLKLSYYTVNSLVSLLNCLKDYASEGDTNVHTLNIGSNTLAKLTDEQKMIPVNKGWFLSGYNTVRIPAGMDISGFTTDNNVTKVYIELTADNYLTRIDEVLGVYTNAVDVYFFDDGSVTTLDNMCNNNNTSTKNRIQNVTFIEGYFENCNSFGNAFHSCTGLVTVTNIPNNIEHMSYAFFNNTALTTVSSIPSKCTHFGMAFRGCRALTSVPENGWTGDLMQVFFECSSLNQQINIVNPIDLTSMFTRCSSLEVSPTFTGTYTGTIDYLFSGCGKLTNITLPTTWRPSSASNAFQGCTNLVTIENLDALDMSKCTNIEYMFRDCTNLINLNIPDWNVSKISTFTGAFYDCRNLSVLNVSNWRPINLNNMQTMFKNCSELTELNISNWGTLSKVSTLYSTFDGCTNLTELVLPTFTTTLTNMQTTFANCTNLITLDLSNCNFSNITNYKYTFKNCTSLTKITLNNITDTSTREAGAGLRGALNTIPQPVEIVMDEITMTDFSNLFQGVTKIKNDIIFPTNTTNVSNCFKGCTSMTHIHSNWNNPYVLTINHNYGSSTTNSDFISVSDVETVYFESSANSYLRCIGYDSNKNFIGYYNYAETPSWVNKETFVLRNSVTIQINRDDIKYIKFGAISANVSITKTYKSKNSLENTTDCYAGCTGITHCDGVDLGVNEYIAGLDEVPTAWGGYGFSKNKTVVIELTIPSDNYTIILGQCYTSTPNPYNGVWMTSFGDGTYNRILAGGDYGKISHTYEKAGTYILKTHRLIYGIDKATKDTFTKIINIHKYLDVWGITEHFGNCTNLIEADLSNLAGISFNARGLFGNCNKLTKVTAYGFKPSNCQNLFKGCSSLTEIIGADTWDMSNCTNIEDMFFNCSSLPNDQFQVVSTWNVPKVTNIGNMFRGCSLLTSIDISNFTSLNIMEYVFINCSNLEYVKLGGNITKASQAFRHCGSLTRIDNFNVNNSLEAHYIFHDCNKLSNIEWKGILSFGEAGNNQFMMQGCPLSVDTIVGLFNILATVTEAQTLTIGSTNLAKLTDEQIAIATNKGWTVS